MSYSDEEKYALVNLSSEDYYQLYPHRGPRAWASMRYVLKRDGEFDRYVDPEFQPPSMTELEEPYAEVAPSAPTIERITGVQAGEKPDLEAIKAKARAAYRRTHEAAVRKQWQEIKISHGPAMIVFAGDQHLGSPGTDIDRVYYEQELINNTPGAYVFLVGDVADSFLVGRLRDQNMTHDVTIPDEWLLVEDYVNGWRDDTLLGFIGGNHDGWSRSLVGRDLHRDLIANGKVLYDCDDMRVTVHVGMVPIRFRIRHQFRGSSQWNVSHAAEKAIKMDDPWPDILVSGHTHTGALAREFSHAGKRKIAIQTGSYKRYDDYAVREGFPMTDNSTAAAVIVMPDGSYFATGSLKSACSFMRAVYDRNAA